MGRIIGTSIRSLRTPVFKKGDDLVSIVVDTAIAASEEGGYKIEERDILALTESIVARTQGNYATIDQIAKDVDLKFGKKPIGVVFPILSRNRFSVLLRGFAKAASKIYLQLSYPSDEVGNSLFDERLILEKDINPYISKLNECEYRELFGYEKHRFTGIDYIDYYRDVVNSVGCEIEFIFSNNAEDILDHTKDVIACDVHTRFRTIEILKRKGANVYGLHDILNKSVDGSGYNTKYGILGSNKATEESVKLFPNDCDALVRDIQERMFEKTGVKIEVMVYGDGAFKDPVGKIWELADPVVGVGYTDGLKGTPNELKLKYLADEKFSSLQGDDLKNAILDEIAKKDRSLVGSEASEGTTPRQLTDLIGSLCDLSSGSGDKGTPVIYIKGYFDNYASE